MAYRSYCPHIQFNDNDLTVTDPLEIHHIKNVLRLRIGENLTIFDGQGTEYFGIVKILESKKIDVQVQDIRRNQRVRPAIILACAIPKKGKFELIIEKATELDVDEIIPLLTRRTEVVFKEESLERKMERFENVAISAAKQCQRSTIPVIHPPIKFEKALEYLKSKTIMIIPSLMGERQSFLKIMETQDIQKGISFLIGPEGDFTAEEYQTAWSSGCIPVTLGETILRVETAAISVVAGAHLYFDKISSGGQT